MGVCAGREGGVHQWGHCVMSAGSLGLLWCVDAECFFVLKDIVVTLGYANATLLLLKRLTR